MKRSPPPIRPDPKPRACHFHVDHRTRCQWCNPGDPTLKREPVRTSFDRVFPNMPPALRLSA